MILELLDNRSYTKSVDVYAFGILLWEIFAEEIPFNRCDVPEIRNRVLAGKRPAIPSYGFPNRVAALITRCWLDYLSFFLHYRLSIRFFAHRDQDSLERPNFTEVVDELFELEKTVQDTRHTEVRYSSFLFVQTLSLTFIALRFILEHEGLFW